MNRGGEEDKNNGNNKSSVCVWEKKREKERTNELVNEISWPKWNNLVGTLKKNQNTIGWFRKLIFINASGEHILATVTTNGDDIGI